jgi:hypothetical protein
MLTLLKGKTSFTVIVKYEEKGKVMCEQRFTNAQHMLMTLSRIDVSYTDIHTLLSTGHVYTNTDFGKAYLFFK